MEIEQPAEPLLWEDGEGNLSENRTRLSEDKLQYARAMSAIGRSAVNVGLEALRIMHAEAVESGADAKTLHSIAEAIDVHHLASLMADDLHIQLPPAA